MWLSAFFCFGKNAELSTTKVYKAYKEVSLFKKTIYGRPFKDGLYKIEEKKVVDSVDIKTAVIYRLNDLIKQKDITVNEAAVRSGVPPSTLKNILYGQSRNAGVVTIKKICDGLDITIQEFFEDPIFADLEPEL